MNATTVPGWAWDRVLLVLLAALAASLVLTTRHLVVPYPEAVAWFDSAAFFPSLALVLAALCAGAEAYARRHHTGALGESDELDASQAQMGLALAMLGLFGLYMWVVPQLGYLSSTWLFLLSGSRLLGLGWRTTWTLSLPLGLAMWWVFAHLLKVHFGHGVLL